MAVGVAMLVLQITVLRSSLAGADKPQIANLSYGDYIDTTLPSVMTEVSTPPKPELKDLFVPRKTPITPMPEFDGLIAEPKIIHETVSKP